MGGCATKPKVFKGDEGEVPDPGTPREAVPAAKEAADVVVVAGGGEDVEKEVETDEVANEKYVIDDDNKVDDQSNKRSQSLGNLFNEKEKDVTTESENTPAESILQESTETDKQESSEPLKQQSGDPAKTESVTVNQETKEPEKPMEPEPGFPGDLGSAQPNEDKLAPEAEAPAAEAVTLPDTESKETAAGEKKDKAIVEN